MFGGNALGHDVPSNALAVRRSSGPPLERFPMTAREDSDMRTRMMTALILLSCVGAVVSAGADVPMAPHLSVWSAALRDGEVIIPPEWAGIWEILSTAYDCETEEVLSTWTFQDTLCTGSVIQDPDAGFEITCTGTADGTTVTNHCEGSGEIIPGCTAEFTFDTSTTRTGDTFVSTTTSTINYVGEACLGIPDSCIRYEQTATRIASEPTPCADTPVELESWGAIKALYR